MKEKETPRKLMLIMAALSASLVFLWVVFYYLTLGLIQKNMQIQAETSSEVIMSNVEEKLLLLEEAAYELSKTDGITELAVATDPLSFYDAGAAVSESNVRLSGNSIDADNIIVFNADGLFYRLKGTISNTAINRAFYLMGDPGGHTITVTYNNNSYLGPYEPVYVDGQKKGYVLLLMEQVRLEKMLSVYNNLDYLRVALFSGDKLLCSNQDLSFDDVTNARAKATFIKEKEIGLSGYRLLVYCENNVSEWLSGYFRVALPVTIVILIGVVAFFMHYLRRNMFLLLKERTLFSLLKKQISAHFTVNTLNVVRVLINKDEKQAAARICDELSTLLRYANAGDEYISLLDEFYVLEQYVGIMQARYPGKIEAEIEPDDSFSDIHIPRMLIQPLIENAIVHGLAGEEGKVSVSASVSDGRLCVSVTDNGRGMSKEELEALNRSIHEENEGEAGTNELKGVALKNIERRIKMVCGPEYGLSIESTPGKGTKVLLILPVAK